MRRRPSRGYYAACLSGQIAGLGGCCCLPPSGSSSPGLGLAGIGDDILNVLTSGGTTFTGALDEKTARLESALKLIIALSGIAAAASVFALLSRGRT